MLLGAIPQPHEVRSTMNLTSLPAMVAFIEEISDPKIRPILSPSESLAVAVQIISDHDSTTLSILGKVNDVDLVNAASRSKNPFRFCI